MNRGHNWRRGCKALAAVAMLAFGLPFAITAWAEEEPPHIVFLVSEDEHNYEAHETIPPYAQWLEEEHGFRTSVIQGEGEPTAHHFPDLEIITEADLVVVFFRRRALSEEQLGLIKGYLEEGNPLAGIRTANHAFAVRENVEGEIAEGYEDWHAFVPGILGCENRGYGPVAPGTQVVPADGAEDHPVLENVEPLEWWSEGNVYHVAPLVDEDAEIILMGSVEDDVEPIAWTRWTADGAPVFYTSLGHPSDFERSPFRTLLLNGMRWALEQAEP